MRYICSALIGLFDTIIILNLLPYMDYYSPLKNPFDSISIKLCVVILLISLVSIGILIMQLKNAKLYNIIASILLGNGIVLLLFKIIRISIDNVFVYRIFKFILPVVKGIGIKDEINILICFVVYIFIAKLLVYIKDKIQKRYI